MSQFSVIKATEDVSPGQRSFLLHLQSCFGSQGFMQVLYCPLQFKFSVMQCAESSQPSTAELSIHLFSITTSPALRIKGCWSLLQLPNGKVWLHPGQVGNKSQGLIGTTVFNTCGLNLEQSVHSLFMSLEAGRVLQYLQRTNSDTGSIANTTQLEKNQTNKKRAYTHTVKSFY